LHHFRVWRIASGVYAVNLRAMRALWTVAMMPKSLVAVMGSLYSHHDDEQRFLTSKPHISHLSADMEFWIAAIRK
jgi:hypothetical protein